MLNKDCAQFIDTKQQIGVNDIHFRHFGRFVNQSIVFWQFGADDSLARWKQYFGPLATIVGIDSGLNCTCAESLADYIRIGDISDVGFLESIMDEFGPPDIVLEGGACIDESGYNIWDFLYKRMGNNGVYLIEGFDGEGQSPSQNIFIEHCKDLLDNLNARNNELDVAFANLTHGISFYANSVVFEKKLLSVDSTNGIRRPLPAPYRVKRKKFLQSIGLYDVAKRVYRTFFPEA